MNTTETQSSLNPNLVVLKPIVCLQTAAAILGPEFSAEHVLRDIKRGPLDAQRIEWAWDISLRPGRSLEGGKGLRVLTACVPLVQRAHRHTFNEVIKLIFGDLFPTGALESSHLHPFITIPATVLARRLACVDNNVLRLAKSGLLAEVPHSRRRGRTGSPAITWESIVQFLTERRFR